MEYILVTNATIGSVCHHIVTRGYRRDVSDGAGETLAVSFRKDNLIAIAANMSQKEVQMYDSAFEDLPGRVQNPSVSMSVDIGRIYGDTKMDAVATLKKDELEGIVLADLREIKSRIDERGSAHIYRFDGTAPETIE